MLEKKYYDGTQIHRIISEEVKDYDTFMKILKRFADEPSALGTNLAEVGTDCISRQAAIDALAKNMPSLTTPDGCGEFDHDIQVTDEAYVDCMQIIHELPSAHPTQKEAKWKTAYLDHESMGRRPKILYCSRCNQCAAYPTDFCPACGADMRRLI